VFGEMLTFRKMLDGAKTNAERKVLLAGKVQVPKIACVKEIFLEEHGLRVMPLAVKKGFQQ